MHTTRALTALALLNLAWVAACSGHIDDSKGSAANSAGATAQSAGEQVTNTGGDRGASPALSAGGGNAYGGGSSGQDTGAGNANSCPAVAYFSHADITADLPISVADAATAVFTACRNSECYSGKPGKLIPDTNTLDVPNGAGVTLTFDDAGPSVLMIWSTLGVRDGDEYKLSVASPVDQTPLAIFDTLVAYQQEISDPTLAGEGFAKDCSQVDVARVDLRSP